MSHDDSTKEDSRLNMLSLAEQRTHRRMEALASEVAKEFSARAKKLRALRPEIERIKTYFSEHVRGSVTLMGCRSFKQYCETKLCVTEQAAYAMLGEYHKKRKDKEKRVQKQKERTGGALPTERQEAAVMALDAVNRFRTAKTAEEKDQAWREYEQIADSGGITRIAGDRPNFQLLLVNVLDAAKKLEEAALRMHGVLSDIVTSGTIPEHSALLASVRVTLTGAEELLVAGKELAAIRRRLNVDTAVQ